MVQRLMVRACHVARDTIGLGLEAYDATGEFRSTDGPAQSMPAASSRATDVDGDSMAPGKLASKPLAAAESRRLSERRSGFAFD